MADLIELSFDASHITARYGDGSARPLSGVDDAVELLRGLTAPQMPVTIQPAADQIAAQTAELAGMRLERRGQRLFLLRPGHPPAALLAPGEVRTVPPPRVLIELEFGLFNDSEHAYATVLLRCGRLTPPKRFHNFGTATFLVGSTSLGRVRTLFRNLVDYGPAKIDRKLVDWDLFVRGRSSDPMDAQLVGWFEAGVDPRDVETLGNRDKVVPYFKAWALFKLASSGR